MYTYLSINYSHLHACYEVFYQEGKDKRLKTLKEEGEVIHKTEDIYRIKTINGHAPAEGAQTLKIKKDRDILVIERTKLGEWGLSSNYLKGDGALFDLTDQRYRQCRKMQQIQRDYSTTMGLIYCKLALN